MFTSLRTLGLAYNNIYSFAGNTSLPFLTDLDLGNSRLGDSWSLCLSDNISLFENLRRVNLGNNGISRFDQSKLQCLKHLEKLNLKSNMINRFHIAWVTCFNEFQELNLRDNWINHIRRGIFPRNLMHIDFSGNDFSVSPPTLCKHWYTPTSVVSLNFSGCFIQQLVIDNWAICLPNLEKMDLSDNLVYNSSNQSLRWFPKLQYFDLSGNPLKYIGNILFNSSSLTHLSLKNNSLRFNEDSNLDLFKLCPYLTHLDISYNALGKLDFGRLENILSPLQLLTELNMNGRKFNSVPTEMLSNHNTLKVLSMENNYLVDINFLANFSVGLEIISFAHSKIRHVKENSLRTL